MTISLDGPTDQAPAGKAEGDRTDRTVGEVGEGGDAAHEGGCGRAQERAVAEGHGRRDHGAAVGRLEVAVHVQLIDNGLGSERAAGRRCRRGLRLDRQPEWRGRADCDVVGRARRSPSPENSSAMVPAVISFKPANVATPSFTVTDVVPSGRPFPLASATLTIVLLSVVSRLPLASST